MIHPFMMFEKINNNKRKSAAPKAYGWSYSPALLFDSHTIEPLWKWLHKSYFYDMKRSEVLFISDLSPCSLEVGSRASQWTEKREHLGLNLVQRTTLAWGCGFRSIDGEDLTAFWSSYGTGQGKGAPNVNILKNPSERKNQSLLQIKITQEFIPIKLFTSPTPQKFRKIWLGLVKCSILCSQVQAPKSFFHCSVYISLPASPYMLKRIIHFSIGGT